MFPFNKLKEKKRAKRLAFCHEVEKCLSLAPHLLVGVEIKVHQPKPAGLVDWAIKRLEEAGSTVDEFTNFLTHWISGGFTRLEVEQGFIFKKREKRDGNLSVFRQFIEFQKRRQALHRDNKDLFDLCTVFYQTHPDQRSFGVSGFEVLLRALYREIQSGTSIQEIETRIKSSTGNVWEVIEGKGAPDSLPPTPEKSAFQYLEEVRSRWRKMHNHPDFQRLSLCRRGMLDLLTIPGGLEYLKEKVPWGSGVVDQVEMLVKGNRDDGKLVGMVEMANLALKDFRGGTKEIIPAMDWERDEKWMECPLYKIESNQIVLSGKGKEMILERLKHFKRNPEEFKTLEEWLGL